MAERTSEFLRRFRERADAELRPHLYVHGDDAPLVKLALRMVQVAEEVEEELGQRRCGTSEASDRTRWSVETLQHYAKAKLAGEPLPDGWDALIVEKTTAGYSFVLGSIPEKPSAAA